MNVLELYVKTTGSLEECSELLASLIQIGNFHKRYGENRGGEYFEAESFGLKFELLTNSGEILIPERKDWPYYVLIYPTSGIIDKKTLQVMAEWLALLLKQKKVEAEVDCLS